MTEDIKPPLDTENLPERHKNRQIRSFVLRTGRMTDGQKRAYEGAWPNFGLDLADGMIVHAEVFKREAPLVLEIGFGMGDSLIDMAEAAAEQDFIGIEVHTPGVGRLLSNVVDKSLTNLRVYCDDAVEVLDQCIADNSLDKVQIFFPDPWHKKKHNKRRIIQTEFVQKLRTKLKVGGVLHLATDWEHYAEQMMEVMSAAVGYSNSCGEQAFSPRPEFRPITKFERRGQRLGHGVWDLLFEKQG
ncbi:MAG: tRNA (guanosine(46)-N7)-methyltransferase TrmB [Pseudomonadales bacterium]|nr:tRNA (guanosine(46)-N7)-methyltransferase TrmB [Pseudomonadales bacterium]